MTVRTQRSFKVGFLRLLPEDIGCQNVKISLRLSICHVTFSRPLIGQKKECYIVQEVIEVDELDKGNTSAAAGIQEKKYQKDELSCATLKMILN